MKGSLVIGAIAIIAIILSALFTVGPLSTKPAYSVSIVDDLGRVVDLRSRPERIVSMAPSVTEILFALGVGDRVVGVTDACDYPPEALNITKIREPFGDFQLEKIVDLKPDLVVMDRYLDLYPPGRWLSKLEDVGTDVVVLYAQNFDDVFRDLMIVGKTIGREKEAKVLVDSLKSRLAEISSKTSLLAPDQMPRVFVTGWYDGESDPWTSGYGTFADDIIKMAGGRNVAQKTGGFSQISLEELIGSDPEIIIVLEDYRWPTPTYEALLNEERLGATTAVKEGKIYKVDANLLSRPGPRLVDGLEEFARILYPELFD